MRLYDTLKTWLRKFMQTPKTVDKSFLFVRPLEETRMAAPGLIGLLEELSLNAWPALQTVHYDGWVLRFADGYTRRANSVNPTFSSSLDVDEKINYCETLYQARQQKVVFKMTPLVYPANLDSILAKKWYSEEAVTSVQTLDLSVLEKPSIDSIAISETVTDEWLSAYCRLNNVGERNQAALRQILNNIVPRRCFVSIVQNGETASLGMAVVDRGYVGLFDIVTDARLRRRGLGRQLVLHLLNWGKANSAAEAYLQVMLNNGPALHLYSKLGFKEVYQYWYRAKAS